MSSAAAIAFYIETFARRTAGMLAVYKQIAYAADSLASVLIQGESGTGKELVARALYRESPRAEAPFIKVNCAALPHDLLESELFGYERGAFTGAFSEKPGKFELAGKGTILLDEIGEMSPHLQAKLLHVLQDSEYSRLGGKRDIATMLRSRGFEPGDQRMMLLEDAPVQPPTMYGFALSILCRAEEVFK